MPRMRSVWLASAFLISAGAASAQNPADVVSANYDFVPGERVLFAEDFSRIHYVNCDIHQDECAQMNIQRTPTWVYNEQRLLGVQTFANLAQLSGCSAP